jgi:hypothetical protein
MTKSKKKKNPSGTNDKVRREGFRAGLLTAAEFCANLAETGKMTPTSKILLMHVQTMLVTRAGS